MGNNSITKNEEGKFIRFFNGVERVGNKLPHPFYLFTYLMVIALVLSVVFQGTSVTLDTQVDGTIQETIVSVRNLLTPDYIKATLQGLVGIYSKFPPLGLIMVMMIAIGFAQYTGLFDAFMINTLLGAPPITITFMLAMIGVLANLASNAGVVFAVTIGAALFSSLGRNPIIGAVTGYAAAHGGHSANLIIAGTDVLLTGITESAATGMNIDAPIHPMMNYYFMFTAALVVPIIVTVISEKFLPKFVKFGGVSKKMDATVTDKQKKGLKFAGIALIFILAALLLMTVPKSGFLRADDGTLIPSSPLIKSVVAILFIVFVILGTAFGIGSGTIKGPNDVPKYMGQGLKDSVPFFVTALPAAFFIHFFSDSNLATILSVKGANMLMSINFTGIPLVIAFALFCGVLNLFMTGASEKWMILAPIFVPMFAAIGLSPALTQIAYRIGDTTTNPIAPINYYLPIVLGIMNQYKSEEDPEIGIGSLVSMTLPFSMSFLVALLAMLVIWMVLGLPVGPGAGLYM